MPQQGHTKKMRGGRHGKRGRPGTCREVIALLSDYLDGGLLPGVTADLARHLEGCAACARFFDSLKTARAAVVRLRFDRIPEEVHQRLRAFLRAGGRVV